MRFFLFFRRNGLLVNHIFAILGGMIAWPCVQYSHPVLIYVGRALHGINGGITIGIGSIYLTELAPRELRGAIGACSQLAITLGIVWSYVMTLSKTFGTKDLWPVAVGFNIFPALLSLILLPFCPESPRFLFVGKKNEAAARAAFLRLNSRDSVETFIGELRAETEAEQNQVKFNFTKLFTQRDLRMPVLIACLIQVLQQLSGINAVSCAYKLDVYDMNG